MRDFVAVAKELMAQGVAALPDLPRPEWTARKSQSGEYAELVPEGWEDEMWAYGTVRAFTSQQMEAYGRACFARGHDASEAYSAGALPKPIHVDVGIDRTDEYYSVDQMVAMYERGWRDRAKFVQKEKAHG